MSSTENLSENLKLAMEERGVSVSELGRQTGLSRSHLHKILNGENCSLDTLDKISGTLLVSATSLIGSTLDPKQAALVTWEAVKALRRAEHLVSEQFDKLSELT